MIGQPDGEINGITGIIAFPAKGDVCNLAGLELAIIYLPGGLAAELDQFVIEIIAGRSGRADIPPPGDNRDIGQAIIDGRT